ncbi:MAG: chemoreceptor glutamine deamidase CheD [Desulfarculus sp.]|nr:chemoreceptor glutamine deamidase CheD [Desulfarculus sp.]
MLKRYHAQLKRPMVIIQPGEYYVTKEDEVIATVLGSCISVCVKDELHNIGGMNHFMLPGDFRVEDVFNSNSARYGMYAMEMILGDILKLGGDRQKLTAKVFGGGHVLNVATSKNSVPAANIQFVKAYLSMEGIQVIKSDVGGYHGRKVLYLPQLGKVYVKHLVPDDDSKLAERERQYQKHLARETKEESVTIF